MIENLILPKNTQEFSLQQRMLHALAKKCWGDDFILRKSIHGLDIFIPDETEKLIAHRETVLNNLSQILNTFPKPPAIDLPESLKDKLVNAVLYLQQGYHEAVIWEQKCQSALPFTILNPLTADQYKAGNFIDPTGHFDDLLWAKYFVADENQFIQCRFELACFYGFEEAISHLWQTMKSNNQLPYEGRLTRIRAVFGDIVGLWAYQLENKFDELIAEDDNYADGFYVCGFTAAIFKGHEYAARFFWEKCSATEKANFLGNPDFEILSNTAENDHTGLVNFIYSLLPIEQKNNLISWTLQNKMGTAWIGSCLLHSPFYESVLNDILTFPFPIPSRIYASLLSSLTYKIAESQIPRQKTLFKMLWNHLPPQQRKEVLEMNFDMVSKLTEMKAMDLLQTIIQPLLHPEKEQMLLQDWRNAGRTALNEFAEIDDYEALLRYLHLFFIDRNPSTQKLSLRFDATNFLDRFIQGEFFIYWTENELPESKKKEVDKVIERLQGSLQVIDKLFEQVEQTPLDIPSPKQKSTDRNDITSPLKRPAKKNDNVKDNAEASSKKPKLLLAPSSLFFTPVSTATEAQMDSNNKPPQAKR